MKKKIPVILLVVLSLCGGRFAGATIIEYPLNCAGTYSFNDSWETDFELGVEFVYISHVYIDWSGEITAGRAVYRDEPDNPFPKDVGISIIIGNAPSWRYHTFWGGASSYPDPEPFTITSEITKGSMFWSELFDGEKITITYKQWLMSDGWYVESGTVTINDAKLVIDGGLVPEPMSILLLAMGTIGLRLRKRNNKC